MENTFRNAASKDLADILAVLEEARAYFKETNIDQWQDGYPFPETIETDIQNGNSYLYQKGSECIATAALCFTKEPEYETIYEGSWHTAEPYASIHRIAVKGGQKGRGVAAAILKNFEKICQSKNITNLRVDTHRNNLPMQKFLKKNGFQYCGIIYLPSGAERFAFDKIL